MFPAVSAAPPGADRQSLRLWSGAKRAPIFPVLVELATGAFPCSFRSIPIGRRKSIRIARIELAFASFSFAPTLAVLSLLAALLGALRIPPHGRLPLVALARLAFALAFSFGTLGKSRVDGASEGIGKGLD